MKHFLVPALVSSCLLASACGSDAGPEPTPGSIYSFANGCFSVSIGSQVLTRTDDGSSFAFAKEPLENAARFFMKPSDLGTYLFYDADGQYLVAEDGVVQRKATLLSDVLLIDDSYESEAEWELQVSSRDETRFQLRHRRSGEYLTKDGLVAAENKAGKIGLHEEVGCAEFPELTLDASGDITPPTWDDGSVFGIVDTHSHIMSNFGFGGGGIFHGAPFHRLGVEHALPDCAIYHGEEGRADLFGFGFDTGESDMNALITAFVSGMTPEFNHFTDGYPTFTEWPSGHFSSTHQTQYYKWLQRAWMGGLRLVVQHATTNRVICDLLVGLGSQEVRYSCNDMVAVDRIIEETYNLERYIDAQEGGPGAGWFRIVKTPAEARDVINAGKMAVVLGIETTNLFDCLLVPPNGAPRCTEEEVIAKLDEYYGLGVRAMFPVHKFDNAFSAGDGDRSILELGNFIMTGHFSNFVEDCDSETPSVFDKGAIGFPGINHPREDYFAPPPNDFSNFVMDPIAALIPFIGDILMPPQQGDFCQNQGLTALGEFLLEQMMRRGMIIELDHLPRRSYARAFEIIEENDYPAAGTHGLNNGGRLYALGGVSKTGFGRCRAESETSTVDNGFQNRIQLIRDNGGFPAEGFGFDLNGFAGAPGPRFGERSGCNTPQTDPVTYPFQSFAGDATFTAPRVGERDLDFNTEGFVHIGMLPELIEDVRNDGVTDEDLEPLFKSAEGYIRMWEKAERRGAEIAAAE